jgi:DNA-binding ferritin-like protein
MTNVAEQVVKEVAEGLQTYGFRPLDSTAEKLLKGQIVEIVKDDHKIRQLVRKLTSSLFVPSSLWTQLMESGTPIPETVGTGVECV